MPLDYEAKYKAAYAGNVTDTPRAAQAGELDTKINNFCTLHGFKHDDVVREIANNRMLAALFAINPNKQNIYENLAGDYIKQIKGVSDFAALPNRAKFLMGGGVFTQEELKRSGGNPSAKTIDFEWNYNQHRFYASHKYTKQGGGTQDNQYKDLKTFIDEANKTHLKKTFFIAIADGAYYQMQNGRANTTRMKSLELQTNKSRVFACDINGLEALMKKIAL